MTRSKGKLTIALAAGVVIAAMLVSTGVAAISPAQIAYDDDLFWTSGSWVTYEFKFFNRFAPGDNNTAAMDGGDKLYLPTASINATIRYNVTAYAAGRANVTETIAGISIKYNNGLDTSPFIAWYNTSASLADFVDDFVAEVHGGALMGDTFGIPSKFTSNTSIDDNVSFTVADIVNQYVLHKENNTAVLVGGTGINKFIVSSNITGDVGTSPFKPYQKMLRHGLFYTPMAFAGLNHTFWVNTPVFAAQLVYQTDDVAELQYTIRYANGTTKEEGIYDSVNTAPDIVLNQLPNMVPGQEKIFVTDAGLQYEITIIKLSRGGNVIYPASFGLWSAVSDSFGMRYREDETYTFTLHGQDAFRWRNKFEIRYPKVDGIERMFVDTETGIMLEYYTEQTRWDAYVPDGSQNFYANVRPHGLEIKMTGISVEMGPNATVGIPGYPVLGLLVAAGAAIFFLHRKLRQE